MKQIILTGDRPTGNLHVGHYVGSLAERVKLQNSGKYDEIYIMIADAQALTDNAEHPERVRQNIMKVALDYLAVGIDPEKANIFIQSMVPQRAQPLLLVATQEHSSETAVDKTEEGGDDVKSSCPLYPGLHT